jgi:hypothetical protein
MTARDLAPQATKPFSPSNRWVKRVKVIRHVIGGKHFGVKVVRRHLSFLSPVSGQGCPEAVWDQQHSGERDKYEPGQRVQASLDKDLLYL